jgi:uncharacterized membrane protein
MKKNNDFRLGVGASSILMILLALFLSTFAVLSLASARSDAKQTQTAIESTQNYYLAESETEEIYAQIDAALYTNGIDGFNSVNIETDNITVYYESDQIVFAVPIDDDKVLESTLQIVKDGQENYTFNVISKKMIVTSEWSPDNSLNVWKGE